MDKLHDECGIVCVSQKNNLDVSDIAYLGLNGLQHRGQESVGMAVSNNGSISCYKEMGLVTEVFDEKILSLLKGDLCIGHVKYSSLSENFSINAQPFVINYKMGSLAVAFNGGIINSNELRNELEDMGVVFTTQSTCEMIATMIARENKGDIGSAIAAATKKLIGGFSLGIMTEKAIIGVRDPLAIRPLCYGKIDGGYIIASESCAIDVMGGEFIRDILPGEILIIEDEKVTSIQTKDSNEKKRASCIFEYIYFARPDSTIDEKNVYVAREIAGQILASESPVTADIVIGVPDSGTPSAIGYAAGSKIPYSAGLIKNKYIGRSFIEPTKEQREMSVRIKLNPIKEIVNGKKIVLVDDSIVRGTTMTKIISTFRQAGAKEVHLRISSPPISHSCYFGVDTPDEKDLIANEFGIEAICESLGADSLAFISPEGLLKSLGNEENFYCTGCFTGKYPL